MKEKGWLKENIRSVIAILWTLEAMAIFIILLFKPTLLNETIASMVITSIVGIVNFVLGYYFGSSKSQNDILKGENKTEVTVTKTEPKKEDEPK